MADNQDDTDTVIPAEQRDRMLAAATRAEAPVVILDYMDDETGEAEDPVASGNEVSYDKLYTFLLDNEDIIITIDEADLEDLRRGISTSKYVQNNKLKAAGAPQDLRQIDFKIIERIPDTDPAQIKLQMWLKARKSVHLHRLVISSKGL